MDILDAKNKDIDTKFYLENIWLLQLVYKVNIS